MGDWPCKDSQADCGAELVGTCVTSCQDLLSKSGDNEAGPRKTKQDSTGIRPADPSRAHTQQQAASELVRTVLTGRAVQRSDNGPFREGC